MVDLNVVVKKNTTKEEVNALFNSYANEKLRGILGVDKEYRVSTDFNIFIQFVVAEDLTQVIDGNMIKVMSWYDNEWGYSTRLVDMAKYICS